jgi:hypothetical protein
MLWPLRAHDGHQEGLKRQRADELLEGAWWFTYNHCMAFSPKHWRQSA